MAAAKETSENGAVAAVLSELDGIFTSKEEKITPQKALFSEKHVFALLRQEFR